jgi:transposase
LDTVFSRRSSNSEKQLRDDAVALRARLQVSEALVEQLQKENAGLKDENARLSAEISKKDAELTQARSERDQYCQQAVQRQEELLWYQAQYFGLPAKKTTDHATESTNQLLLFTDPADSVVVDAAKKRKTTVAAHVREHSGGHRLIPKHFHRNIIPHELAEDERMCYDCEVPHPMTDIGVESVRECYRIKPPQISVDRHERHKYACQKGSSGVIITPVPPAILPKSMASPSLLAHLVTKRTSFASPIYRTCRELKTWGLDLSNPTACRWVNTVGLETTPVIDMMSRGLFEGPLIEADETYLQVLKSDDKAPTSNHFMVVRAGGAPDKRVIIYSYLPSRTKEGLKALFIGPNGPYQGMLLTDGLGLYDDISADFRLLHFGCWQHARQYFVKAAAVSNAPGFRSLADTVLVDYISKLFKVEAKIEKLRAELAQNGQQLPPQQVREIRQQESKPLVDGFKQWVDAHLPGTPPQSLLGKAISYTLSQWPKLVRFLDHGDVPIHNNSVEQQNKHFAVGRKNWLFNQHEVGAKASANLYSLDLTCVIHGVVPFEYFEHLFEYLPAAKGAAGIEALLPWNVKPVLERRRKEEQEAARKRAEEEAARIKAQQSVRRAA